MPVSTALIEKHLRALFAGKGERVVAANVDAFRRGDAAGRFAAALIAGGAPASTVARVVPRLDFDPEPVPDHILDAWLAALRAPGTEAAAARMFASNAVHSLQEGLAALATDARV